MAAEPRVHLLASACEHLAAAVAYMARATPLSPPPFGAPQPQLQLPDVVRPLPLARPHHQHLQHDADRDDDHIRFDSDDSDDADRDNDDHHIRFDSDDSDNDDANIEAAGDVNIEAGSGDDANIEGAGDVNIEAGSGGADAVDDGADDDDDDFEFALHDAYHCIGPLLASAPPYPLYRCLPDGAVQTSAWVWYLFFNALLFTGAVTFSSIMVFRTSRRLLPTFLRAVLLAVSLGAEAAAAFHLPPASVLATALFYTSAILHMCVYLGAWAFYCIVLRRRRRRRRLTLP